MNNLKELTEMYKKTIKTKKEGKEFLKEFYEVYPDVHPEDDMSQVFNGEDDSRTFTDEEVNDIHERLDEIYCLLEDPCGYIIDELQK